ncbi:hypothetical protein K7A42_11760 [Agrobacterium sp. InxBP2]|uniref:hypothetical protein n=1 Tax=Agrobacterium sp. InxBP2 TaxID=2870329 RepID=UPI00249E9CC8|nr:hypothetical protein [Agrobacterium sp. InxBP2]MCW8281568.1 hypothetical protein [Agrobacterium sp. InxBP2]
MSLEKEQLWKQQVDLLTDIMNKWIAPCVTPLTASNEHSVNYKGTGTFVSLDDKIFVLTARHVADEHADDILFHGSDQPVKLPDQYIRAPGSLDSAILPIPAELWQGMEHEAQAIQFEWFAGKFDPFPQEVYFFRGYAGENAQYAFDINQTSATGYCTQINADFTDDTRFFYLLCRPSEIEFTSGTSDEAQENMKKEKANGFSGSLVWETGLSKAMAENRQWKAEDAKIVGQVVNWDQNNYQLVVRRIEDVNKWLLEEVRGRAEA